MLALGDEYTWRYGRQHLTIAKCALPLLRPPSSITQGGMTRPRLAAPRAFKERHRARSDDSLLNLARSVQAYRDVYNGAKRHLLKWTRRKPPVWVIGYRKRIWNAKRQCFVYLVE